jgi:hypothetical protein
MELIYGTTCSD